jgi:hypothetical protein
MLALSGGGVRGVVELAFLARIEALLAARYGRGEAFRLAEYFDLIAGTSTGAIIAAGLSLGMSVAELTEHYLTLGPLAFHPRRRRIPFLSATYDARVLARALHRFIGDRTLDSPDLRTGLVILAKRFDTGSVWTITNSPHAPYWEDDPSQGYLGNRNYRLAEVVRASTAAPTLFEPQRISVVPGQPPGLFVDGGVSPHNSPVLPLLMVSQLKAYGLCWPTGPERLLVTALGAGTARRRNAARSPGPLQLAVESLLGMIGDAEQLTLLLAQWLSEPTRPRLINSEIGTLNGELLGGRALFSFVHYDLWLESEWLLKELNENVSQAELRQLQQIDRAASMPRLLALATRAANRQVLEADFPATFDLDV